MKYESIRMQVLAAILQAAEKGLIHGTSGNIAVRDFEENVIAITPSGRPYDTMTVGDIAVVDLEGNWIDGPWKPSSETPMHTAVYRARPDVGATVHTHAVYCTIMAMSDSPLQPCTPPHAEFLPARVVPFALPGSEQLARQVVDALGSEHTVLLQNHGCFCAGRDIAQAMSAAAYVEEAAQIACCAQLLGTYRPLTEEQIARVRDFLAQGRAV